MYAHTDIQGVAKPKNVSMQQKASNKILRALTSLKNKESLNRFYDPTAKKAKEYNFVKDPSKSRKRKSPTIQFYKILMALRVVSMYIL